MDNEGVIVSVGFEAGQIGSVVLAFVSSCFCIASQDDTAVATSDGPAVTTAAALVVMFSGIPSPIGAVGIGGGDVLSVVSVRELLPRAVLVLLLFRTERGDFGVRLPRGGLRSSVAFFSLAACSSAEGMTSFIFRRPEARFSTSSDGETGSEGLDGKNAFGTLGTGGALRGLVDRFGVPEREFGFRRPVTVPVADFNDADDDLKDTVDAALLGVRLAELVRSSMPIGATPLTLFLRLASTDGDSPEGLGRSLPSIVCRLFFRIAC